MLATGKPQKKLIWKYDARRCDPHKPTIFVYPGLRLLETILADPEPRAREYFQAEEAWVNFVRDNRMDLMARLISKRIQ